MGLLWSLPGAQAAHLTDQAVVGVEITVDDVHGVEVSLGAGARRSGGSCQGPPALPLQASASLLPQAVPPLDPLCPLSKLPCGFISKFLVQIQVAVENVFISGGRSASHTPHEVRTRGYSPSLKRYP